MTIAESERGPELIEHKNTIATQLHIETKYMPTVKILENFVNNKFELITEMSRADMTLKDAENYLRSIMYTKGPGATKSNKKDPFEVKTRGKALFVNKNSFGIETNSVKKDAIRPSTAKTGYSTFSGRNITTRASSRQSCNRATTASTGYRVHKPRLFSAERKLEHLDEIPQANKTNQVLTKQMSMPNSLLWFGEQSTTKNRDLKLGNNMTKANKKLIKKFNQFIHQNRKCTNSNSQRLMRTMKKYIKEELHLGIIP